MKKCRLILADDHQMFLDGIEHLLKNSPEYEVVAFANSGEEVLELLANNQVDILTLDIQFKGTSGIEIARMVKNRHPNIGVLMISMLAHISHIKQLMRIGVEGYILKEGGGEVFLNALRKIRDGEKFYSEEVVKILTDNLGTSPNAGQSGLNRISLSKREFEVLQCVAKGMTTTLIAEKLFVAPSTIVSHRKNIMQKLEVKNVAEMIRFATEMGLLE